METPLAARDQWTEPAKPTSDEACSDLKVPVLMYLTL